MESLFVTVYKNWFIRIAKVSVPILTFVWRQNNRNVGAQIVCEWLYCSALHLISTKLYTVFDHNNDVNFLWGRIFFSDDVCARAEPFRLSIVRPEITVQLINAKRNLLRKFLDAILCVALGMWMAKNAWLLFARKMDLQSEWDVEMCFRLSKDCAQSVEM